MKSKATHSLTQSEKKQSHQSFLQAGFSALSQIQVRFGSRLIPVLSVAAAVSTGLVGIAAFNTWNAYRNFQDSITKNFQLQESSDNIVYYDEVLTMSARMAASTGNLAWEERYLSFVPKLDEAINTALELAPEQEANVSQTDDANQALISFEEQAFDLVRQGNLNQALQLLLSPQYNQQKEFYTEGISSVLANIQARVDQEIAFYQQQLGQSAALASLSLPISILSWLFVLLLVRSYIQERVKTQASLEQLNTDLQARVEQLDQQERATREESEVLQKDVTQILDGVSAVEAGDLTVEVPVSDRVTGLVADTINRLTEELAQVLGQVLNTAQAVSNGALQLENVAQSVSTNADKQAVSVQQVLHLTQEVEAAAQASSKQIQASNHSLLSVRTAVEKGQSAIASLTKGINVLQQGTTQIVQQMKTLGEFVGLTDQFVQDQREIASLTQVLAMNASLVAARASEQRDPNQFVVVAREFESIANQVGSLAQRTNEGLINLEQRSTQIHNVVSAVDANVQNLDGLVEAFTQGVQQSTQVFSNVRTVTGRAVKVGQAVSQSSQQIGVAAQSTTELMADIAQLATQTAQLTQQANQQTERMESLSQQLLENIRFFRLPSSATVAALPPRVDLSASEADYIEIDSSQTAEV